ncbi:MAG: GAF domain-containing protein [Desulfobacteraceae bacterium]|nr:GAF domain-containing protein [Desulfobacteraceae bacterium]
MSYVKQKRAIGRRESDLFIRKQNERYSQLCEIGKTITAEIDIEVLFPLIMEQTNKIMNTQRSTVFLHDEENNELWSLVATGMNGSEIRIPDKSGIAGWVFQNKQSIVINDAYGDPRFNVDIDCRSGFKTENILCVPLINSQGDCIGVLQTLNPEDNEFTDTDNIFLSAISDYVAISLENARLYNDVLKYTQDLQEQILINESLVKVKDNLTKFVPASVANLAESNPEELSNDKVATPVSVLFVDFEKFSSITENHDQRIVNHMVENHFSNYLKCIHNYGGELNETSGDGIMVIFKSETIEGSALNSVKAALDIIKENKRINKEYKYPWGKIKLHLGISSGEAYVGITKMKSKIGERWTYTASGFVTILASRIGSLSKNNRLYIGEDTYDLVHDKIDAEFTGTYQFKNVTEKVPVYEATRRISTVCA